eukprot:m.225621 g.225621  ORF g.225621 m.225621 type:complete len:76 (+) comp15959_c1_seq6:816-1043(+)
MKNLERAIRSSTSSIEDVSDTDNSEQEGFFDAYDEKESTAGDYHVSPLFSKETRAIRARIAMPDLFKLLSSDSSE